MSSLWVKEPQRHESKSKAQITIRYYIKKDGIIIAGGVLSTSKLCLSQWMPRRPKQPPPLRQANKVVPQGKGRMVIKKEMIGLTEWSSRTSHRQSHNQEVMPQPCLHHRILLMQSALIYAFPHQNRIHTLIEPIGTRILLIRTRLNLISVTLLRQS